jgi:hypothetical protein
MAKPSAWFRMARRSLAGSLPGEAGTLPPIASHMTGGAGVIVIGQNRGMTSKNVPKIVPMFQTGTRTTKQRRGFAPVR